MAPTRPLVLATLLVLVVAPVAHSVAVGTSAGPAVVDADASASDTSPPETGNPVDRDSNRASRRGTDESGDGTATGTVGQPSPGGVDGVSLASPAGRGIGVAGALSVAKARTVVELEANSTNYLDIANQRVLQDGYARSSVDIGAAIERDVAEIRSNYTALSFEYANADRSTTETIAGIRSEVDRIERRIEQLSARYQQALSRYGGGEWTTGRLLRELAVIDALARGIEYRLDYVSGTVRQEPPQELADRISKLRLDLLEFQGPVRDNVGDAMAGERDAFTAYVATGADGVVLSRTDGLFAYREAYLGDNRAEEGTNLFVSNEDLKGLRNAINRVSELYPWAWSNTALPSFDILEDAAYRFTLNHPHGRLDLYLDGRTTNVFREVQRPQLDSLPTDAVSNASDGLVLRVNRTYGTGPMAVTVTDDSDAPLNATVTVNGFRVGSTGPDGRLWTVTPYEDVRVVVKTADGRQVTIAFTAD